MASAKRPLSPHLQVYRPQITSVLSILHRITGVALAIGAVGFAWWLNAASYGPGAWQRAQAAAGSWLGQLILFGMTFALFYHLANGIRHLAWDAGVGFELKTLRLTGWLVVIAALGLTGATWFCAFFFAGGA